MQVDSEREHLALIRALGRHGAWAATLEAGSKAFCAASRFYVDMPWNQLSVLEDIKRLARNASQGFGKYC